MSVIRYFNRGELDYAICFRKVGSLFPYGNIYIFKRKKHNHQVILVDIFPGKTKNELEI